MSRRDRALTLAMPLVLVAVATFQQVRAHTVDQSSWNGSGFGMFATYDSYQTRRIVAWTMPDRHVVRVPDTEAARWARIVPETRNLRAVAAETARVASLPAGTRLHVEIRNVDVDLANDGVTVSRRALATLDVDVGDTR